MKKIIITEEMLKNITLNEIEENLDEGFFQNLGNRFVNWFANRRQNKQRAIMPNIQQQTNNVLQTASPINMKNASPVNNGNRNMNQQMQQANQNQTGAQEISDNGLDFICRHENYPNKDGSSRGFLDQLFPKELNGYVCKADSPSAGGHKTFGYGLLYHPDGTNEKNKFMDQWKPRYTQEELQQLFRKTVNKKSAELSKKLKQLNIKLSQNQFDAVISAIYQLGSNGFFNKAGKAIWDAICSNPLNPKIIEVWKAATPKFSRRRNDEANLYATDLPKSGIREDKI